LALSHAGDAAAMPALRAAYARLVAESDAPATALCAAALVVTTQVGGNFRDVPAWLAQVKAILDGPRPVEPKDDELLLLTALLIGQLFFELGDPEVDRVAARILELLETDADVNLQLAAARMLLYYVDPRELRELGQRVNSLVQPRLADPALAPHRHGHWLLMWRSCSGYAKEASQEDGATQAARALAERHGLRDIQFSLAFDEVAQSLPGADLPRAERALAKAEALVDAGNLRQLMLLDVTRMRLARLKGQNDEALFRAVRARKYAVELHCPGPMMGAYIVNEANARLSTDDFGGARAQMEEALPLLPEGFALEVREMIEMIAAFEALTGGEPQGRSMMARVWAGLRARQFYDSFDGHPEFRARLCMLALEQQIEVEFVTSLIRKCKLVAPTGAPESWPFPLRIHALGQFSLQRDGAPIAMEGKAQRKPLDLLRVLVAYGATSPSTGMQTEALIDMLWPDLEADAPRASFDMTLMRLRKLLQVDGALRLAEGRLWLEPRIVWCDVTAFEQDCSALHTLLATSGNEVRLSAAARRLRSRQGNKLFGNSAVEPWSIVPRERLARQFAHAVSAYGQHLEAQGAWIAAVSLYEQGLADDLFAEPWYRGLMRCHLALDQPAAALRAFHRCRELLASVLKVPPSADTLALLERIPTI
jgi:DNA-binding SARP family transcriptional activator